jgi:hypothetical protein
MAELFGLLSGVIGVAGYIPYTRDILRLTTKPDRVSWLIWSLEYTVLFLAQFAKGATNSLWLVGLQLLGVLLVSTLSLRYGVGGLDRRKIVLLACVALALILWYVTKNASVALCISLVVEASGVVLTAIKVYKQPDSETLAMWWLVGIAGVLGVPAVGRTTASILFVYPISLVVMSSCVVSAAWLGARRANAGLLHDEELMSE